VIEMPLDPTPAFGAVKDLDRKAAATAAAVKAALMSGPLFTFGSPTVTKI
jgi:hypothetical protein